MAAARTLRRFLAASYAWILALFLGAVLLDIVYSRLLDTVEGFSARPSVYSEVSDFLLLLGALMVLFALAAIAGSWNTTSARNLLIVSILIVLSFEFLAPIVLSQVLRGSQGSAAFPFGPWLRLAPGAVASLLAFAGLGRVYA